MNMPWTLYIAQLNEAGKITARSIMDVLSIALTVIEEQDIKIKNLESSNFTGLEDTKVQPTPVIIERPTVEDIAGDGHDGPLVIKEEPKVTTSIELDQPPTKEVIDMQEKIAKTAEEDTHKELKAVFGDKPPEPKLDTT